MDNQIEKMKHTQQPLKRVSVFLVWLFSFLTLGIYAAAWYLKRKPEFDKLGTQKKLSKGLIITYLIFMILFAIPKILELFIKDLLPKNIIVSILLSIITLAFLVIHLTLAFNARTILNELWESKGITRKVSWFFTLVFNILYLQYEINRTIENRTNKKRTGIWIFLILVLIIPLLVIGLLWSLINEFLKSGGIPIS